MTEDELKKLTVPQLKSLCKEKKITGYSKLAKDAIIQRLLASLPSSSSSSSVIPSTVTHPARSQAASDIKSTLDEPTFLPNASVPVASAASSSLPLNATSEASSISASQAPLNRGTDTIAPPHAAEKKKKSAAKPRPKKKDHPSASHKVQSSNTKSTLDAIVSPTPAASSLADPASTSNPSASFQVEQGTRNPISVDADPRKPPSKKRKEAPTSTNPISADVESAPSLHPKKRKLPLEEDSPDSDSNALNQGFKIPALPDRTKVPTKSATIVDDPPTTISGSLSFTPKPNSSPKNNKMVNKPSASSIPNPADTATPSSTVSKRKKIDSSTNSSKPFTSRGTVGQDDTPPTLQNISSTGETDPPRKVAKRPLALPSSTPTAKKQKLSPLLPIAKSSTVLTPQLPPSILPSLATTATAKLPQPKGKRFLPLVVTKKPAVSIPTQPPPLISTTIPTVNKDAPLFHLDFPPVAPPPSMTTITLPPKRSERKNVPRLSLLLSHVGDEDLKNCVFVSRVFRYAVYISAFHRLNRDYPGKRLSMVLMKYPAATTNTWPYLQQRRREVLTRKSEYASSFLSRAFAGCTTNPISDRLWTSPAHERQIVVALRFLLTRLFFQVSVGGEKEGRGWNEGQIVDAQELVKDEIWMITVRHSTSTESFYVLEPTCEPLTSVPTSTSAEVPVRADWSAYIAHRAAPASAQNSPARRLLDYLSWPNHEEYQLGISRIWQKRIEGEGEIGRKKCIVAERYILACVVANSLSGRYMSATQMAQEFAGLSDVLPARVAASPKVNLFLPAHHHVESVHFTTAGRPLHVALAIVQTPARFYYILRDNGMQVGCEEDGVAEVWMNILGCDNSGVAL
ncbi:hypothetical protein R3P38DRAFT_2868228 [Favolaschia claudopus]|uniref:Rho termination factor-like N-terminal domain-containing protein n=1 Tax=Favolaschia claudopus TaxID=2862362 RepID=A0AAW0DA97_9AGAR